MRDLLRALRTDLAELYAAACRGYGPGPQAERWALGAGIDQLDTMPRALALDTAEDLMRLPVIAALFLWSWCVARDETAGRTMGEDTRRMEEILRTWPRRSLIHAREDHVS